MKNKIENNKLIATFMHIEFRNDSRVSLKTGKWVKLKYHKDWNHLMPVVQKIFKENYLDLGYDTMEKKALFVQDALYKADIKTVYKAIVKFIK